jgi:hypothetical protein
VATKKESNIESYNFDFSLNRNAFVDVIGDPFAIPEPVQGNRDRLIKRSSIMVATNDFDSGHATRNAAQPSQTDFICDIDRIIDIGFNSDTIQIAKFYATYITEEADDLFTAKERQVIEQTLGKLFRKHSLSPVSKYFQTVRTKLGEKRQHGKARGSQFS